MLEVLFSKSATAKEKYGFEACSHYNAVVRYVAYSCFRDQRRLRGEKEVYVLFFITGITSIVLLCHTVFWARSCVTAQLTMLERPYDPVGPDISENNTSILGYPQLVCEPPPVSALVQL